MTENLAEDSFYVSLPIVARFDELADPGCYRPLPADWYVAVADVAGSTLAIAAGRYKAVNTVGVSAIAAITNALKPVALPYIFGGDGATVCVPEAGAEAARRALAGTVAMARQAFDLELRAGLVPVSWLHERGHEVLVARHRVSPHYDQCALQCALHGGGAPLIEALLKSGELPAIYRVDPDARAQPDYGGLECRWREIPSRAEETIAVIVQATEHSRHPLEVYRRVIQEIEAVYGDADQCRPVFEGGMRIALSSVVLDHEARVQSWRLGLIGRLRYAAVQRVQAVLGWLFFTTGARIRNTDWSRYKGDAVENTDFRKLDGSLRLILSGTAAQREALTGFLEELSASGDGRYGIHVSDSSIMTCLVRQRQHEHVHFVDAAGGGYAAAAEQMKGRMRPAGNA